MTKSRTSSVTIRDVAREAGVSVATVSRYLNHNTPVSEEVAERLQQVMRALKYVPQATARALATHKTHTIGLLLADIGGDFFAPLLNGIEAVTSAAGYDLLISCVRQPLHQTGSFSLLGPHNTDGVLIFADSLDDKGLGEYSESNFPTVLIHRSPPEALKLPCVTVENRSASKKIVDHLIEVHFRKHIVFLRGPKGQEDSFWREAGYRQALEAHDLPFDQALVAEGEFDRTIAGSAIQRLLKEGVPFDGVFAGDDEAAVGVLNALREGGKRIPEDVAVVGFDDQRMAPYLTPPLTTVRAPTEEVGSEATRQLLQNIQAPGPCNGTTLLPTELVIRRSCGCNLP
jgi:DNA-binding LacI/PurR family transcriptional regulator